MALIKCPECNKEISDSAKSCPHCGFPLPEKVQEPIIEPVPTQSSDEVIMVCKPHLDAYLFQVGLIIISLYCFVCNGVTVGIAIFGIAFLGIKMTSSRKITLKRDSLSGKIGLFTTREFNCPIMMVSSIEITSGLFGKSDNYGNVTIRCAEGVFKFDRMAKCNELRDKFFEMRNNYYIQK